MTKFNFYEVFERKEDGKLTCRIDPRAVEDEYKFTMQNAIKDISNQHRKILDDWCKAYLAKEYEIGNDIHPGCFTIEQREVSTPGQFGYEYMISPNDQNLGERVKWKSKEEEVPPKDGTKFFAYVSICIEENRGCVPGKFRNDYKICWFKDGFWRTDDQKEGFQILKWMKFPIPEEKIPYWKKQGWCCENLYNSTLEKYSESNGYPTNPGVLQGDDNSLFIGKIQERINLCPWCGEYVNKEQVQEI